jgi:hypothetical protein
MWGHCCYLQVSPCIHNTCIIHEWLFVCISYGSLRRLTLMVIGGVGKSGVWGAAVSSDHDTPQPALTNAPPARSSTIQPQPIVSRQAASSSHTTQRESTLTQGAAPQSLSSSPFSNKSLTDTSSVPAIAPTDVTEGVSVSPSSVTRHSHFQSVKQQRDDHSLVYRQHFPSPMEASVVVASTTTSHTTRPGPKQQKGKPVVVVRKHDRVESLADGSSVATASSHCESTEVDRADVVVSPPVATTKTKTTAAAAAAATHVFQTPSPDEAPDEQEKERRRAALALEQQQLILAQVKAVRERNKTKKGGKKSNVVGILCMLCERPISRATCWGRIFLLILVFYLAGCASKQRKSRR